ncbi:MAG: SDR family NAD(P)-dependent oxidoreductase, partial [Planctomycetales bacterium]|nr:SDR family NAD(P)-dependent oxidoreductase [Planctomycetales bacterium]
QIATAAVYAACADIASQDGMDKLITELPPAARRPDIVIHCVGRSTRGHVLETTPDEFDEFWRINFLSAVRVTRAFVPQLKQSRGHLVLVGSLASKLASRYLGAYPASKFPLAAYAQQLRLELAGSGMHVLLFCPGPIARTDAGTRYDAASANLPDSARAPAGGVKLGSADPQRLARKLLRGCERRLPEIVVPAKARWLFAIAQLWPRVGDWLLTKLFTRQR